MKQKKPPLRECAGCGERKPKKELVRIVRAPVREENGVPTGGEISLDLTGRKPGRGVYLCPNPECLKKAQKAKRLERALSAKIGDEVYAALLDAMPKTEGGETAP